MWVRPQGENMDGNVICVMFRTMGVSRAGISKRRFAFAKCSATKKKRGQALPPAGKPVGFRARIFMTLYTKRLILRPWRPEDASQLYFYAKDPIIGLSAGWAPHPDEHESMRVIEGPLGRDETYAIVLRDTDEPIGSVGLLGGDDASQPLGDGEAEIGYWIGFPHWGNGYAPEAVRRILKHAFEDLDKRGIWGSYFDENARSGRVQAKTGFVYHHTEAHHIDAMGDERIVHYTYIESYPGDADD